MRIKEVGNLWQGEDSNPITSAEIIHENNSLIQESNYNLTYHAKQLGKGLLVFGAGLLGYLGFRAFFGGRREAERGVDSNLLAFQKTTLLNEQATINGISTSLDQQAPKGFVPTSFSTPRTLLNLQEKEDEKDNVEIEYLSTDSTEENNVARVLAATRRAVPLIGRDTPSNRRAIIITDASCNEFQVNAYTTNDQKYSLVTSLNDGGFVVLWSGEGVTESSGVYGQRYNAMGNKAGSEFQANTYTTNGQEKPSVAALKDGGFVVTWQSFFQDSDSYGIYGQRYNVTGSKAGSEFQINTYTTNTQANPSVATLTDGGFVVTWDSFQDGSGYGIYGQRYNATGNRVSSEFQINNYTTNWQLFPAVAHLTDGGFVVVWDSNGQDGSGYGVYSQRYNATGQAVGTEFRVNTYTSLDQQYSAVAHLTDGGFVVTWTSLGQDGAVHGIFGQRYNATGDKVGSEFQVNTYTVDTQWYPSVSSLINGGFVVTWSSSGQDGSNYGVYGQLYNATGDRTGSEFQVNTYTPNYQQNPSVSGLSNGGFVVTWTSLGQDGEFSNMK